jgi:hypothetical protein
VNHDDFNRLSGHGVSPNDGIYILIVTMVFFTLNLRDYFFFLGGKFSASCTNTILFSRVVLLKTDAKRLEIALNGFQSIRRVIPGSK